MDMSTVAGAFLMLIGFLFVIFGFLEVYDPIDRDKP